ncbi:hypothetical protein CD56_03095 [Campylobacter lari]|uniref:hypothetical protein n=1 Tax=Campylobacter lari TaxID=201 RepID=UPI0006401BE1|nr:hypothetical protein [Campylobacter lari]AKJ53370.1 hypothetical protein CD56_03095 [Campylobacter lari]
MNLNKIIIYIKNPFILSYIIGIFVLILSVKINNLIIITMGYLLLIIPAFIDLYKITKRINIAKIYNLFVFFGVYLVAEFCSRDIIYNIVDHTPDSYSYTINIFNIIIIIPIIIICTMFALSLLFIAHFLIPMLSDITKSLFFLNLNFLVQKIFNFIIKTTHFKNKLHIDCFVFFGVTTILQCLSFFIIGYFYVFNFSPNIIHIASYYKNNTICSKVPPNAYIHLLGDNKVSISPFNEKFVFHLDKNRDKFITRDCN